MQMLATRPHALPHPSELDRMEERPTSRSCVVLCCVVWEGNGSVVSTDGCFGEVGMPEGKIRNFGFLEVKFC